MCLGSSNCKSSHKTKAQQVTAPSRTQGFLDRHLAVTPSDRRATYREDEILALVVILGDFDAVRERYDEGGGLLPPQRGRQVEHLESFHALTAGRVQNALLLHPRL